MEAVRKPERYTYADYCKWPDDERWELIDGIAYAMAAPSLVHQRILLNFARQLGDFLDGKTCMVLIAPCDVRLNADGADDDVVQPDVFVVCDKKKLEIGKSVVGVPDLVIEILSPTSASHDMIRKYRLYQRAGVSEYWIVDPIEKVLIVNTLRDGEYSKPAYFESDEKAVPVSVLEGCSINLVAVFEGI